MKFISKFMTSQPGKETIAISIKSNISRSKSNQTMKFGQVIAYNMKDIESFFKNRSENMME